MLDRHGAVVMREHVGQAAVGLWRLVEIAADEMDALAAQPRLHGVMADAALADDLAGLAVALALGLGARHHAAGAVHGRVEARGRRLALDSLEDHGVVAHRAADEAALARERRRCALAHDPQITLTMAFAPGVVVMVVDRVEELGAEDPAYALHHPLAARIGIMAGQRHRREIACAELALLVQ